MDIQPAHINQVVAAGDGRFVEISGDVCGVAADLKQIDPKLGVRFALHAPQPFFAVYYRPDERTTELVLTQKAYQGSTGVWMGLDQRVVERVREISSESYDFAGEVVRQNEQAEKARDARQEERLERASEQARFEFRRLMGGKSSAFFRKGS